VADGFFNDLWIWLHDKECKPMSSTGGIWIFPQRRLTRI